jgi:hypothetical protein
MMPKNHGSSVKDNRQYEALRRQGESKEKAARIANTSAGSSRSQTGRKGGAGESYEDRSLHDLRKRAAEIGIEGRSRMKKKQLIEALRNHRPRAEQTLLYTGHTCCRSVTIGFARGGAPCRICNKDE